jgi:hypothetical protein
MLNVWSENIMIYDKIMLPESIKFYFPETLKALIWIG